MIHQHWWNETYAIGQPTCLFENDTFKMWYNAGGLPYITSRVMYAWSLDGVSWTKYTSGNTPVLQPGATGSWDVTMDTPEILHDSSGYKLYYFGDTIAGGSNLHPSRRASFGVATSPDGITWTKYAGNPILTHGSNTEWDRSWIESPAVLWDSAAGTYLMWYSGVDTLTWRIGVGLATSPDGFTWTKYAGNPVLAPGAAGSYDDMWAAVPAVIKRDSTYEMWYSGLSSTTGYTTLNLCYATSTDGINWTRFSGNPLFDTHTAPHTAAVDSSGPWAPDVVFDGSEYRMWYETAAGFCLATSDGKVIKE
jgi:sucrose-6-phosphate hydrolase SacC (GH32 family)